LGDPFDAQAVKIGELRLRARGRPGLGRRVEQAIFRQPIEPRLLPFGILDAIGDLIFQLPVLVEDESAAAKNSQPMERGDVAWWRDTQRRLELVGLQRENLNVFGDCFVQQETVGTDPKRGADRLDFDVAVRYRAASDFPI